MSGGARPLPRLLPELLYAAAEARPDAPALIDAGGPVAYGALAARVQHLAGRLPALGLGAGERLAIYLPKTREAVALALAATACGAAFVFVNPVLRPPQVAHVIGDSGAALVASSAGWLARCRGACPAFAWPPVLSVDGPPADWPGPVTALAELEARAGATPGRRVTDGDLAGLFYTSGSTGLPRGVAVSHRNLVAGAAAVAPVLGNRSDDRILALLPLGFDAGFSQLTTAFFSGAAVVLAEFVTGADAARLAERHGVTGITGVPPLWAQLADADWPGAAAARLRYFASTGGTLPAGLLARLRAMFPAARPYLMYGLTEAFRSTILPAAEVDRRPGSIGLPLPGEDVRVLRPDGSECAADEPGELVHRGALVSLGYWRRPDATAARFRPVPGTLAPGGGEDVAVWSGDTVVRDAAGYLYFRGRGDAQIKTSGYRVSPDEVEAALLDSGLAVEAAVFGVPDERLGERIVAAVKPRDAAVAAAELARACRERLARYMVPAHFVMLDALPRGPNGKYDRAALRALVPDPAEAAG